MGAEPDLDEIRKVEADELERVESALERALAENLRRSQAMVESQRTR